MAVLLNNSFGFLLALLISIVTSKQYDPMVAFVCDRGAMHMDSERGWFSDGRTDCLETKENILSYCKQVYPTMDIRNIVETTELIDIKGWCPIGDSQCSSPDTFKVQPYRCLVGDFQGDSLVVTEGCKFKHVHGSKDECKDFTYWKSEAAGYCTGTVESYGMLLPCGTDMWGGVEFVCCSEVEENTDGKDSSLESLTNADSLDTVERYKQMKLSGGEYSNEHEVFELARKELTTSYQDKVAKLMVEWSAARDNVMAMKGTDPTQAEQKNREVTTKYEKKYLAVQNEEDIKMAQLDAIHQQRVQTNFNYKKRISMQRLMEEMQSSSYDVEEIGSLLQRYISVERKNADHCIKHYMRIKDTDPRAASDMKPTTIERLTLISTRIDQSIDLLDTMRDKDVAKKIKSSTRKWLKDTSYDIDSVVKRLTSLPNPVATGAPVVAVKDNTPRTQKPSKMYTVYRTDVQEECTEDSHCTGLNEVCGEDNTCVCADGYSLEDHICKESQVEVIIEEPSNTESMVGDVNAAVEESIGYGDKDLSAGAVVAIAAGLVAAMMVVLFAILIVKQKSSFRTRKLSNTYLEVASEAPDLSPEDRHIVAMQNGYENPTYALLEQRKT